MAENDFFTITADTRWKIAAQDPGHWRIGIYRPEYLRDSDIRELEKHTCPELFICAEGEMGLVVYDGKGETVRILHPGDAAMLTDYHNGFCASEKGYFIVAERTTFETEFIDRNTKSFLRSEGA
ncbi:MAG: hypothetical protein ACRCUT_02885 [Spirochaetota bacterium]